MPLGVIVVYFNSRSNYTAGLKSRVTFQVPARDITNLRPKLDYQEEVLQEKETYQCSSKTGKVQSYDRFFRQLYQFNFGSSACSMKLSQKSSDDTELSIESEESH